MRISLATILLVLIALTMYVSKAEANKTNCTTFFDCKNCTDRSYCVWCRGVGVNNTGLCQYGNWLAPDDDSCGNKWRWGQCVVDNVWLIVAVASFLGLVLLGILLCVLCCCCCPKHKKKKKGYKPIASASINTKDEEAIPAPPSTGNPEMDKKRAEMRRKWGSA